MKLLLLLKAPHYLRPFVGTVQRLADRGHRIEVAWFTEAARTRGEFDAAFAGHPSVTFSTVSGTRSVHQREVATLRRAWNFLRYLDKPYRPAVKLRRRALEKVVRLIRDEGSPLDRFEGDAGLQLTRRELQRLQAMFEYVESVIPPDPVCESFLLAHRPDVLLVSPLVDLNSSTQADFVKAAAKLGIPTGMLVYSWDNLSTKGGLHTVPDRVFVWNKRQEDEAVRLHRVPCNRVVITGGPKFDAFLDCRPIVDGKTFRVSLGLEVRAPIITYVCSSAFVSGHERTFIERWLAALRASGDPVLRSCSVIIRPHPDVPLVGVDFPATKPEWGTALAAAVRRPFDDPATVVLNTTSVTPQGLFETLWHSKAVVGLNTSAEIEAGLLGRPVLSILAGADAPGQASTLHFHYLLKQHGGFVQVAANFEDHLAQLTTVLKDKRRGRLARKRALVFVRPLGADTPAAAILADAIEREFATAADQATTPVPERAGG